MTVDIGTVSQRKARCRITNGRRLLFHIDGRSTEARRFRDLMRQLARAIGVAEVELTVHQRTLIRRLATLALECELAEADRAAGKPFDLDGYTKASNAIRRLLRDLDSTRPPVPKVSATSALARYLATRRAAS